MISGSNTHDKVKEVIRLALTKISGSEEDLSVSSAP